MKREEYGLGKVLELMINNHDMNANDFVDLLVNDVDEFRGEAQPHDDMTTLIFKRVE
jgi:serine phosphatase RsbU (regulator of sigma subunit)